MSFDNIDVSTNFSGYDWILVVAYLVLIVGVGVYIRRYARSVSNFIVAGRALRPCLAIATMIGTEMGLVTVMYASQKGFTGGFAAFHIALIASIVTLVVGLTGFIVVPLRRLKVMTIPEFYEMRFGRGVRILGGTILVFAGVLCMGLYLKAGSIFVMGITGMSSDTNLKIIITVLVALVLLYTTLGGMVSVVILDYIQFLVLSFSLIITVFISIRHLGWSNIINTVAEFKGQAGFDPFVKDGAGEGFGLNYVLWMIYMGLLCSAIWQTAVIRACAADSIKTVKKLYTFSSIGFLIRFLIPYFLGICAFVFITKNTDLKSIFLPEGVKVDSDISMMALPIFLGQILPAGLIGLVTAGMLAALMSTNDSYLLCWSSVLTQDVVAPILSLFKKDLSDKARLVLTRIFIIGIGIFILIWGLWYPLGQDLWDYMAIGGAIYGAGAFSLLVFGLYWKRTSRIGAYLGLIAGFCCIFGLTPVQKLIGINQPAENVGLVVLIASTALTFFGSLLFPDRKTNSYHERMKNGFLD
ncbi:MAG: sodium:solute symporter family protein [Sedimentisphaerales bacterium]|nr:sodium:solute symporter family protein [Sedimentisphaerales bacterium]